MLKNCGGGGSHVFRKLYLSIRKFHWHLQTSLQYPLLKICHFNLHFQHIFSILVEVNFFSEILNLSNFSKAKSSFKDADISIILCQVFTTPHLTPLPKPKLPAIFTIEYAWQLIQPYSIF